ncbi:DUF2909 family protein [Ferrimonas marina]|uniref:DUF2909 domain-containing protein n=1 Tax=Ferrimonas marina TaxID=299255 RepID=A0A1M5XTL1_9GAMM|nr:DUF2909 family protein [Ferrimonas marina]SHI02874.1 Protein of unknown function [Ferrimonas marina]
MVTLIKGIIVLLLLYILFNLVWAGVAMIRGKRPMTHYLGRRVAFSALVMLLLLVALGAGVLPMNPRPY